MLFYRNHWVPGKGKAFKSLNPSDGEIIWEGNFANNIQLKAAVVSASQAHPEWSKKSFHDRLKIIKKFYSLLKKNKDIVTQLISIETGKVLFDAASEVQAALAKLNNSIHAYKKRTGSEANNTGVIKASLHHASHGVLSVIGPFNFPLHLANGHLNQANQLQWLQSI